MNPTIILDPWLLALKAGASPEDYVNRLLAIEEGEKNAILPLEISAYASELLELDGLFPLSCDIPTIIWPNKSDIYRIVGGLISRLPKIEDRGINEILIEPYSFTPPIFQEATPRQKDHLIHVFGLCAVHQERMEEPGSFLISTDAVPEGANQFTATVQDAEHNLNPAVRLGPYVYSVECSPTFLSFYSRIKADCLTVTGEIESAITIAVWQAMGSNTWPILPGNWSYGTRFRISMTECNIENNPARLRALIRTCVGIITSMDLRATHALRTSQGANAPQKTRQSDKSKAWRADIDDELHLHYWATPTGPEFANVVTHNDFDITE